MAGWTGRRWASGPGRVWPRSCGTVGGWCRRGRSPTPPVDIVVDGALHARCAVDGDSLVGPGCCRRRRRWCGFAAAVRVPAAGAPVAVRRERGNADRSEAAAGAPRQPHPAAYGRSSCTRRTFRPRWPFPCHRAGRAPAHGCRADHHAGPQARGDPGGSGVGRRARGTGRDPPRTARRATAADPGARPGDPPVPTMSACWATDRTRPRRFTGSWPPGRPAPAPPPDLRPGAVGCAAVRHRTRPRRVGPAAARWGPTGARWHRRHAIREVGLGRS